MRRPIRWSLINYPGAIGKVFSNSLNLARMARSRGWSKAFIHPLGERSILHCVRCEGLAYLR